MKLSECVDAGFGRPGLPEQMQAMQPERVDQLLTSAVKHDDPQRVVAEVGTPTIRDGYRDRPLSLIDCREATAYVRQVRIRLDGIERDIRELDAVRSKLRRLLEIA